MKELHGSASGAVSASPERCFDLLVAVDTYPDWYPAAVRRAEVVERAADGRPLAARAALEVSYGPLTRSFDLLLRIEAQRPAWVHLTRVTHSPSDDERFDVRWRVVPGRVDLDLEANLSVPRFVPIAGIGDSFAEDFLAAAVKRLDG
jgi:ribosome-associated toxin RatA of RatAB toxin-antitoxin module